MQTGKTGFRMLVAVLSGSEGPNEPHLILGAQEVTRAGGQGVHVEISLGYVDRMFLRNVAYKAIR
jgi:hypothetical protein